MVEGDGGGKGWRETTKGGGGMGEVGGSLRANNAQWEASGAEGVRVVHFLNHTGQTRRGAEGQEGKGVGRR